MFVVLLQYTAPESDIDAQLVDHYEWVTRHYDAGDFIAAGHRHPRTGGVIIARAMPRGRLDAILATDPFALHKLARYEVIEFQALRTVPELAKYADPLTSAARR
ncbi:YciI family protein [Saccharopolyspora thermophila]|uniref:YciI family protein n=1 Tax=Saccharopolyspora thermophila TaxID=89367 RepID=UPI001667A86E|nr:YciI family protein [Saccharopolyspora subtropica]